MAELLFNESNEDEDRGPSEVFNESNKNVMKEGESEEVKRHRFQRAKQAQAALMLSMILKEPGCASICLSQLCLRVLGAVANSGEVALRIAEKALSIAGDGMWDPDSVNLETEPSISPEQLARAANPTNPGLSHPESLKFTSKRVGQLCQRSGYLQKGNALIYLKRCEEGREVSE